MEITGRIEPNSRKIIVTLSAVDFTDEAIEGFSTIYQEGSLPLDFDDIHRNTHTNEYPYEWLKKAMIEQYDNDDVGVRELETLVIVANSIANIMESNIGELQGAPLEINVNMDTWLDKS